MSAITHKYPCGWRKPKFEPKAWVSKTTPVPLGLAARKIALSRSTRRFSTSLMFSVMLTINKKVTTPLKKSHFTASGYFHLVIFIFRSQVNWYSYKQSYSEYTWMAAASVRKQEQSISTSNAAISQRKYSWFAFSYDHNLETMAHNKIQLHRFVDYSVYAFA